MRACLLNSDAAGALPQLLPLTERAPPMWRGAALCRLKRDDEAVAILQQQQQNPLAGLYLALAEHGRGNLDRARTALEMAVKSDRSTWAWEVQQEFELLRREVENLLTPPRIGKLPTARP